jgi:hypothetical protein
MARMGGIAGSAGEFDLDTNRLLENLQAESAT